MSTLEQRSSYAYEYIHWPLESVTQVRDRLYPGCQLTPMTKQHQRSTMAQGSFCPAWAVSGHAAVLIELPTGKI